MKDYADSVQNVTLHLHLTIERKNIMNVTLSGKNKRNTGLAVPGALAKSQEPRNLVPGHFRRKIRIFFRYQRFKEINLKLCCGFVKNRFK